MEESGAHAGLEISADKISPTNDKSWRGSPIYTRPSTSYHTRERESQILSTLAVILLSNIA